MRKRLNVPTVSITLEVPVEVAEFLANHGEDLIRTVRIALDDFNRNPPSDQAEEKRRVRERELAEIRLARARLGRLAYRMLRIAEREIHYRARDGRPRKHGRAEKETNRRRLISEIAETLGKDREAVAHCIEVFRYRFLSRLRDRRRRETERYLNHGLSNKEIASRLKVSPGTVARDLAFIRERQRWEDQQ